MNNLNCWINKVGDCVPVGKGKHMVERNHGDCIRISLPEGRRTWAGIEVYPNATPSAKAVAKRAIRDLRKHGVDIRADVCGRIIEVMAFDRPTELNKALS